MSTKTIKKEEMNNSNNLPQIEVIDNSQTKGKVTGKFNLNNQAELEAEVEKIDKNQLFSNDVADYFCPVKFDASQLEASLNPLVESGIMSEDAKKAAIDKVKREFLEAHAEEITAANKLTFAEVLEKLQANDKLYKKVLLACKVSELKESNYISEGKVCIYRANQCQDKDGNNRYTDCTLTAEENGVKFSANLFVEYRDITTDNILLAIRYYTSKLEAQKSITNKLADYRRILTNVAATVQKAKDNKFTKEQIINIVNEVFA